MDNRKENIVDKGRVHAKTLRREREIWRVQESQVWLAWNGQAEGKEGTKTER